MKKISGLILCLCIIFCTCSVGFVSAETEEYSVSGGNTAVANEISAEEFAQKVAAIVEEYGSIEHINSDSNKEFATARLIVKSFSDLNVEGAVAVVSGFDGLWVLQYSSPEEAEKAFEKFEADSSIEFVEADKTLKSSSTTGSAVSPASVNFKYISWGPSHIGIDTLNKRLKYNNTDLATVYVAVVDTGVNPNHEYLDGRVEPTRINTSGSGTRNSSADDNGHGTQVAGVVVDATLDNVIIKPYKVLDSHGNGTVITVAAGINCAVKDGVDVINVSVGFYEDSQVLEAAVANAHENDIVVVSAAGNDNTDKPMYPSSYDSVIRVAASNDQNVSANFSNYGGIDITAPGVSILTTSMNGGYFSGSGTSLASPLVAAVAATILAVDTDASPEDVENMIKALALESFEPESEKYFGAGILTAPSVDDFTSNKKTATPVFSAGTALYREPFDLTITCETPGSVIYYTTDESIPSKTNPNAVIYSEPIEISKTTKLLAVAYADGHYRSSIANFSAIVAPYASESELTVDENGVLTAYTGTLTSLSIPETVNGITVKKLGDGVLKNRGLTELLLPNTVTDIGKESVAENPDLKSIYAYGLNKVDDKAFYNCVWLKNIYIASLKSVGEYAFYNAGSKAYELKESTFALDIEKLAYIPEGAFMNSAISQAVVTVPLSLGENAFAGCDGLVNIDFADLTSLEDGAFKGLDSLREVRIEKLKTVSKGAFSTCEALEHIHLPDAEYVDSNAFENCASLVVIEIPKAITVYSNAFSNCDSLLEIRLESATGFEPEAYTSNVLPPLPKNLSIFYAPKFKKTVNRMFGNCPKLYMAYLNGAKELGASTFNGCKSMYYLDIRSIEYIKSDAFGSCSITAIDARNLVSTSALPSDSGIILSNEFVEAQGTAENLTVYGTPGTYIERYCKYKGFTFVGVPLIINELPDYITENSEMVTVNAVGFDLEYQWFWNGKNSTEGGTPIDGATENSYIFTQDDTAPFYYCRVTHHDVDRDVVIYSDIIIKDSTPADLTEYNKAVEAAKAVDRSLYINIDILDEALSVDVSNRYSCEQDFVDAQTQAIYDAIANLKHNGVQNLVINVNKEEIRLYELLPLNYMVYPENANYESIVWSCEQNRKNILLNKNGYIRFIGGGTAVIKGEIINPDGEVISATLTLNCELRTYEKIFVGLLKPFWLLIYAMSGQKLS